MADEDEQLMVSAKDFETGKYEVLFPFVGTSCKHNHMMTVTAENEITLVVCPNREGDEGIAAVLSDETKARLEHLEAIEAAQELVFSRTEKYLHSTGTRQLLEHARDQLTDLIREGMKDNVPKG